MSGAIITPEEASRERAERISRAAANVTVADYDRELEEYCREVRTERGYTTQLPTDYANSTVPRWKQDAADYGLFRDKVLLYGLEVENRHAAGEPVPSLEEFKAGLREIKCEWTYAEV